MSPKKLTSLLPPKRGAKRDTGVNVRFTQDEYDELERIASFRETTVTELVYHVVARAALPQLQEEMETEIAGASKTPTTDDAESKQIIEGTQANLPQSALPPAPRETAIGTPLTGGSAQKQEGTSVRPAQAISPRSEAPPTPKDQKQPQGNPMRPNPASTPLSGESSG